MWCQTPVHTKSTHVSPQLYILSVALNIFIITGVLWDSGDPLKPAFETAEWSFRKPVCYAAKLQKNVSEPLMCVGVWFSRELRLIPQLSVSTLRPNPVFH